MAKLWGRPPSIHSCKRLRLDEPWHGNVLLSCGPHKLEPNQQLQEFNADFVPWCGVLVCFCGCSWQLDLQTDGLCCTCCNICTYPGRTQVFSKPERQTVPHALRCLRTIRGSVPDLQLISQQQNCEESLSNSCLLCSLDYTSTQHGRCHGNSVFSLVSKGSEKT